MEEARMRGVGGLDRVAGNERRFIERAKARPPGSSSGLEIECECTNDFCAARIQLRMTEYRPLRASAACYAICPDDAHVDPARDLVVERYLRYWVVERQPSLEVLAFYGPTLPTATVLELIVSPQESPLPENTG
jgi:hypothetical protein